MDYGSSDTSTTSLGTNQFPISDVHVPNVGLRALGGGPKQTDGNGKDYAPALMYVQDGSDVAQGTTTQTKATDGSVTSWSVVQLLKGIFDKLLNTLAVTQSGTWTVQPGNTANTTAWKVDGSGVTQPISQPTSTTGTPTTVAGSAVAVALLVSNGSRKGAYIYNDSAATLYIGFFAHATLTTSNYTMQVPAGNLYELPTSPVYIGEISGIWSSATGNARLTEMS